MPRIARIQFPNAYYHVISRGIERRPIYRNNRDRLRFLEILQEAKDRFSYNIFAYCLMTNHYHLCLKTPDGNLAQIMKYINGSYATYFNAKWKRAGHVFAYKYKSIVVEEDKYLMSLTRYIHLNPLKAKMVTMPEQYKWSSYRNYLGLRSAEWFDSDWVLRIFSERSKSEAKSRYKQFVEQGMDKKVQDPYGSMKRGAILGTKDFIQEIISQSDGFELLNRYPLLEEVRAKVESEKSLDLKIKRKIAIYLSYKYCGKTLGEVGAYYGKIKKAGVRMLIKRIETDLAQSKDLTLLVHKLENKIKELSTFCEL